LVLHYTNQKTFPLREYSRKTKVPEGKGWGGGEKHIHSSLALTEAQTNEGGKRERLKRVLGWEVCRYALTETKERHYPRSEEEKATPAPRLVSQNLTTDY